MSQQEFELYLSLLGRFLRLNAAQRSEIADELRDHLEERLDELKSQGLSQDEAVRQALHEFGDASELATHFTQLAKLRRRRILMRSMYASVGAATAVILLMWGMMRTPEPLLNQDVVAQSEVTEVAQVKSPDADAFPTVNESADVKAGQSDGPATGTSDHQAEIEKKLATKLDKVDFIDIPLRDTLVYISEQIQVDILFDERSLKESGVTLDEPVTLSLQHTQVSAATAIELVFERAAGTGVLTYKIRDGFIYVQPTATSRDDVSIEIYNVRDLLEGVETTIREGETLSEDSVDALLSRLPGALAGSPLAARDVRKAGGPMAGRRAGAMGRPGMGAGRPGAMAGVMASSSSYPVEVSPVESLIRVIIAATDDTWAKNGSGNGTIEEFDGLLVIRQSEDQHREIKKLLDMLRETKRGIATEQREPEALPSY
ncbi:MAG: permease prefix domain 1-containing protein [Planctomycetaceae bacterium]